MHELLVYFHTGSLRSLDTSCSVISVFITKSAMNIYSVKQFFIKLKLYDLVGNR